MRRRSCVVFSRNGLIAITAVVLVCSVLCMSSAVEAAGLAPVFRHAFPGEGMGGCAEDHDHASAHDDRYIARAPSKLASADGSHLEEQAAGEPNDAGEGEVFFTITSEAFSLPVTDFEMETYAAPLVANCPCCVHCTSCYNVSTGVPRVTNCACYRNAAATGNQDVYYGCNCAVGGCDCHFVDGPQGRGQVVYGARHFRRLATGAVSASWGATRVIYFGCLPGLTDVQKKYQFDLTVMSTGEIAVPAAVTSTTIVGKDPNNGEQLFYTAGTYFIRTANSGTATVSNQYFAMYDLNGSTRSTHGLICGYSTRNVTIEFVRVHQSGVEMCHNEGRYTTTIFEDCVSMLENIGTASQRWAHCQNVIMRGGTTYVEKVDAGGSQIFTFTSQTESGAVCSLTIESGATLVIESARNNVSFIEVGTATSLPQLILKENAELRIDMPGTFSSRALDTIQIAEGASVISNPDIEQLGSSGAYIESKKIYVDGLLKANYYRNTSTSTNDICVKASQTMTVGATGVVEIEQHGGIGSAINATGFSSTGKVYVKYNPLDKTTTATTSSAVNIGASLLEIVSGGELVIEHVSGRGMAIEGQGIIVNDGGLIDVYHTPSGNLSTVLPTIRCSGDITIRPGGVMNVEQDLNAGRAYGGNTIQVTSNTATINVLGTLNITQNCGQDTIANIGGTLNFAGDGNLLITKDGSALNTVLKASTINVNNVLEFTQKAGGNAIEAGTLNVNGLGRKLVVHKEGGTGAVYSGTYINVFEDGEMVFDQTAGDATIMAHNLFNANEGARVRITRNASTTGPVFQFNNSAGNTLNLASPEYIYITNGNGPMIGAGTSQGGVSGTTSAINYTSAAGSYVWSNNLASASPSLTLALTTQNGTIRSLTSDLIDGGAGAKHGETAMSAATLDLCSGDFGVFEAGQIGPLTIDPVYKTDQAVTGDAATDLRLYATEYIAPNADYEARGNEGGWINGQSGYAIALQLPTSMEHLSRVYLQVEKAGELEGYAFRDVDGKVWVEAENLVFETTGLSFHDLLLRRVDTGWKVRVNDTQGYTRYGAWVEFPWQLYARVLSQFMEDGVGPACLEQSCIVLKQDASSAPQALRHTDPNLLVKSGSSTMSGYTDVVWSDETAGFLFSQRQGEGEQDKTYAATMLWTLELP